MEVKDIYQAYVTVGAGGLSLIILIWLLVYLVTKVNPSLQSIKESDIIQSKILENCTEALKQVSCSTDNVAATLSVVNHSFNTLILLFEKHDNRQDEIYKYLVELQSDVQALTDLVLERERRSTDESRKGKGKSPPPD